MPVSFKIPDVKQQLLKHAETTNAAAVKYAGPNQIPKEKRFTPMGDGCPVSCRASIVRVRCTYQTPYPHAHPHALLPTNVRRSPS